MTGKTLDPQPYIAANGHFRVDYGVENFTFDARPEFEQDLAAYMVVDTAVELRAVADAHRGLETENAAVNAEMNLSPWQYEAFVSRVADARLITERDAALRAEQQARLDSDR